MAMFYCWVNVLGQIFFIEWIVSGLFWNITKGWSRETLHTRCVWHYAGEKNCTAIVGCTTIVDDRDLFGVYLPGFIARKRIIHKWRNGHWMFVDDGWFKANIIHHQVWAWIGVTSRLDASDITGGRVHLDVCCWIDRSTGPTPVGL